MGENFIKLAMHEKGYGYRETNFFFLRTGGLIAGGDVVTNTGQSGKSAIDNPKLAGENLKIPHSVMGSVASPEVNDSYAVSQFYITYGAIPELDGKSVVFGRVTKGHKFFFSFNQVPVDENYAPKKEIKIIDSEHFVGPGDAAADAAAAPDVAAAFDTPTADATADALTAALDAAADEIAVAADEIAATAAASDAPDAAAAADSIAAAAAAAEKEPEEGIVEEEPEEATVEVESGN